MKNRKTGVGGRKKKVPSDVSPSTSLPPLVEGQVRCFLRVTISRILWTVLKPPSSTFVRLRWWGESSDGTHFFPRDGSRLSQTSIKTTARFPIRCGPKQFTSYLTDMNTLVPEVLTKPDHLPIARAQVAGISSLTQSKPIGGFYTLVSPKSEKLGEIQVSLSLEPLVEAFDSSSSGPPTDISVEGLQFNTLKVPSPQRPPSAGSGKESAGSGRGNTPRGRDHLFFQNAQKDKGESLENQIPTNSQRISQGITKDDVISVVPEHGNKHRDTMVLSGMNCDADFTLKDTPLPLPKDNILPPSKSVPSSSGSLLDQVFEADLIMKESEIAALLSENRPDYSAGIEGKAVELLLGSSLSPPPPFFDGLLSGHSSLCGDSELNDPQYDQSLLENLFYKTPTSDQRLHDTVEVRQETTMSSSKNQQEKLMKPQLGSSVDPQCPADDAGFNSVLNEEQLTLLRSVRQARVTIDSLTVAAASSTTTPRKALNKGKPPRPLMTKKCTYFVEYVFPVGSASSRHGHSKPAVGDVIRAVSSKVTGRVIKFDQLSVFPVHFSTATLEQWWGTDLIFKIYSRKSDHKKAVAIGKAIHPLRRLLESKELSQQVILPVQSLEGNVESQEIGPLKVTLELGADSKSFSSERIRKKLSWKDTSLSKTALSPRTEKRSRFHGAETDREDSLVYPSEAPRLNVNTPQKPPKSSSPQNILYTAPKPWQRDEEQPDVLLHTLLMVPDGKDFVCGPRQTPNVYLNCKLFWCEETARSVVSWGQANPTFNFVQVTPVGLTAKLLERMKNNIMVIEVWQKTGSSGQDQLLGLVKLPLHQFYMSFRDPKIAHLLLQAKYPVLGVDCYMPIIDVFSGSCKGNLRVVLAMGHSEQIVSLQRSRDEECDPLSHLVRPVHLLDHQRQAQTKMASAQVESLAEHLFVIKVERVSGLTPLQSTVWGEADCYVQYSFPCQDSDDAAEADHSIIETSLNLKPFRTTATLCVPDPLFGHTEIHTLMAPEGVPVQRMLLSSLSSQGLSGGGGIQFEVWCRYYYPNVRDQLVARGSLPLSKLCAMVTMQRQHPDEAQKFSVPLIPRTDSNAADHHQPSGLLDVCVRYKHRSVRSKGQTMRGAASRVVTLLVQVHRASGLKAAARLISEQDERFSHFASEGLNPFVTFQLSFLPESEMRCTRTAESTFCPEFNHQTEVSCGLLAQRSSGETCSLAEQLEQAYAVFAIWNKDKACTSSKAKHVMLGTVKIPLADLIHKRTGISGWYGVYPPQETSSSQHQHVLVGGLEVSVTFAHHSHRERTIKAAQDLAWETNQKDDALKYDEESWEESRRKLSLTLSMPRVWLPVHCLLLPGLRELQRSTYCYLRYKFYEQEAFCSPMKHPHVEESGEEGQATVSFEGSRTIKLRSSQPLLWYLREEKLEVQVWVAFKKEKTRRPSDSDRLVGSAFVDLSSLATAEKQTGTLSGVYPLFRRSAADLQGAALRVHITLSEGPEYRGASAGADSRLDFDSQGEELSEEDEDDDQVSSPKTPGKSRVKSRQSHKSFRETPDITSEQHTETSQSDSFPVTVTVDRAMHLNLKSCPLAERSEGMPCCSVSYVTADSAELVSTDIVANTDCPVWNHQHDCRLSKQLLVDPQQSLVFKVWHKGEMERVIGFASVDLSPLLCGFQSVCGWYNITDFTGQCHGQLKVSITPRRGVQDLRGQRKAVNEEPAKNSSALFQALPVSYQTTATYSSFPAHISRYTEQKISSPDHTERLFSERSSESDRHIEHMDNIRLFHQSLQEHSASLSADINPSSSFLFSALRKKLGELDNIQRYFSRKLSTPTFPSSAEPDSRTRPEEHRNTPSDSSQLLLKSNQLVSQVNNIISGLQGQQQETLPTNTDINSILTTVGENVPQTVSCPHGASEILHEVVSPPSTPTQQLADDPSNSDPEETNGRLSSEVILLEEENEGSSEEIEEETDCKADEKDDDSAADDNIEEEEDDDEDLEEVVLKPRPLNEVTSLTDRTSPWTSVLSDPDLVSLESLEEEEETQVLNVETCDSDEKSKCSRQEENEGNHSFNESDSESEKTLQPSHEDLDEEPIEASGKEPTSSTTQQNITETNNAPVPPDNQDVQSSVPVEVPNFFLPSHQLEATMRAISLAPSFSQPFSDTGLRGSSARRLPPRRAPLQRPNLSPTSLKRETDRIAKIFAAQFDDTR